MASTEFNKINGIPLADTAVRNRVAKIENDFESNNVIPYDISTFLWKDFPLNDYSVLVTKSNIINGRPFDFINYFSASSKKHYYSTLEDAVLACNTGSFENEMSSSTGAKVAIISGNRTATSFAAPASVTIIQLLSNIDTTEKISLSKSAIIDLNGFVITPKKTIEFSEKDSFIVIHGNKPGSGIINDNWTDTDGTMPLIGSNAKNLLVCGGTYRLTSNSPTKDYMYTFTIYGDSSFKEALHSEFYNCTIECIINYGNAAKDTKYYGNAVGHRYSFARYYTKLKNCKIKYETSVGTGSGVSCHSSTTEGMILIDGCDIEANGPNHDDQSVCGVLSQSGKCLIIKNSNINASNSGVSSAHSYINISNSVLGGRVHGGIYTSGMPEGFIYNEDSKTYERIFSKAYISNSILRKLDGSNYPTSNNLYSCYFGYDCQTYADNVIFDSYNGSYNRPAIKTGGSQYKNTSVYMSNCKLDSIRCDADCFAYIGNGMPDNIKNASVPGTIIETDLTYSSLVSIIETSCGLVEDVKVDGKSLVVNGVVDIPIASESLGVVRFNSARGGGVNADGLFSISRASNYDIDGHGNAYKPIVPINMDYAIKAAMTDGIGEAWTENEKKASRERMGIPTIVSLTRAEYDNMTEYEEDVVYLVGD